MAPTTWTVPPGVFTVDITYPTPSGLVTKLQAVTPDSVISVKIGDFGDTSTFGTFTMPAYSTQVFRYRGNIDHLTSMDIQVVASPGKVLTTSGDNSTQVAAATAAGLTLTYTYEGWHGDLSSTINMTPAADNTILSAVQVVAGGGGRAQGPSVTAQPTSPNYIMSGQIYDTAGGEGYYDINFTLQQRGYFTISYTMPVIASGWKKITNAWIKQGLIWKRITASSTISLTKLS